MTLVVPSVAVWPPGIQPLPPLPNQGGLGRPAHRFRRDEQHTPLPVKQLALSLPTKAWEIVTWREGTRTPLHSRFTAVRVRAAHRDHKEDQPRAEEWLLIEWPDCDTEPSKYWLSNLDQRVQWRDLVAMGKQRWIIEQDYLELKQELGLGHFEGRGWRGFHHHASLCIAAYGFLAAERSRFSPSVQADHLGLSPPALPE
jgi:SRSO17 transposase